MNTIKRLDVWTADLGEREGSEQRGHRPVLIIQNDVGNMHSPTVIVASITDAKKRYMPTHLRMTKKECGLLKDSVIMFEQIHTIDKSKLKKKVSHLPPRLKQQANDLINISLGLCEKGESI